MYITDMTPKEIKEYNERSKKEFESNPDYLDKDTIYGIIIPLLLFICGILVPFFTDEILPMWFALVPFYGFCITIAGGFGSDGMRENIIGTMALVFFISLVFSIIRMFVLSDFETSFATMTLMCEFNTPASFASIIIYVIFKNIKF